VVIAGCARTPSSSVEPSPLVVVDGATDVRRTDEYNGAVYYAVQDPYPGSGTIDWIAAAMHRSGWTPTSETPLTPSGADGNARIWWTDYTANDGKVDHWTGSWSNGQGDLVTYVLEYEVSSPNGAAFKMKVIGVYMTAATVQSLRRGSPRL
jgi:hypothetical protein